MRPATSLRVTEKKAGTQEIGPGIELAGCPDKLIERTAGLRPADSRGRLSLQLSVYAVLRGRTVRSRTWVKMLDICIPFSCETKGRISAMN
jgi:hypothetical protein